MLLKFREISRLDRDSSLNFFRDSRSSFLENTQHYLSVNISAEMFLSISNSSTENHFVQHINVTRNTAKYKDGLKNYAPNIDRYLSQSNITHISIVRHLV